MPEVVSCPTCQRKSRLPDHLIGKRVKCPGCAEVFTAAPSAPPPRKAEQAAKKQDDEDGGYEVVEDGPKKRRRTEDDEDDERVSDRRRATRRTDDEDDEDDERPRRSRRGREDDEDDEAPRRQAARRKKKRPKKSASFGGLSTTLYAVIGVVVLCLLLAVVSIFVPAVAIVPLVLGFLAMFVGGLWLLVISFKEDAMQGLLCLFVPFYSLYFLITHFEECKQPFFLQLIGIGLVMVGSCAGGVGGARDEVPPPGFRRKVQAPGDSVRGTPGYAQLGVGLDQRFSRPSAAFASTVKSASGTPLASSRSTSFAPALPTASSTSTPRRPRAASGVIFFSSSALINSSSRLRASGERSSASAFRSAFSMCLPSRASSPFAFSRVA